MLVGKKNISVKFSETKLKKRHKTLAVLYDIGSDLTRSLGLDEILSRATAKIHEHFGFSVIRIYVMKKDRQHLELAAYKGLSKDQTRGLRSMPLSKGFSGKSARTKSFIAQRVSELKNGDRNRLLELLGLKVIVCVPLMIKGRVLGVMNLGSKRMISLNQEKIDLFHAIGNQIATAINVSELYEEVQMKAKEIEKKKEELEFFAYTISHDLKNPAIGVYGFARLLAQKYDHVLDETGEKYCQQIMDAAKQIESFTREINEYITAKKVIPHFKNTNVKKILEDIHGGLTPLLKKRHIRFSSPGDLPEIVADASAITRVFKNLIDNALKHGGETLTRISVGYEHDNGYHIFSVSNDGVALKKQGSEIIFEAFRKHPAAKPVEGSGLGLAIVKDILEAHGGRVWFESQQKQGAVFYIAIPEDLETE